MPPLGAELDKLPEDAAKVQVEGKTYYQHGKVFYRKVDDPGGNTYVIVASHLKE